MVSTDHGRWLHAINRLKSRINDISVHSYSSPSTCHAFIESMQNIQPGPSPHCSPSFLTSFTLSVLFLILSDYLAPPHFAAPDLNCLPPPSWTWKSAAPPLSSMPHLNRPFLQSLRVTSNDSWVATGQNSNPDQGKHLCTILLLIKQFLPPPSLLSVSPFH